MHEQALMDDLMRKIEALARRGGGRRPRDRGSACASARSRTSRPAHFREHFEDASRGTLAEGAEVEAEIAHDPTEPGAQGVVLESIDVEV